MGVRMKDKARLTNMRKLGWSFGFQTEVLLSNSDKIKILPQIKILAESEFAIGKLFWEL